MYLIEAILNLARILVEGIVLTVWEAIRTPMKRKSTYRR